LIVFTISSNFFSNLLNSAIPGIATQVADRSSSNNMKFANRTEAGRLLAKKLTVYAHHPDTIVLGLPRGGVPVAVEIAKALHLPLDICLVRKLGTPSHEELAMGAIATGGIMAINEEVVQDERITQQTIDEVAIKEQHELERRDRLYRGNRPFPQLQNRTVILVDDGIATGSTMNAAIACIRQQQPQSIIVATPVAHPSVCQQLQRQVEKVICLTTPEFLYSISLWYEDFSATSDEEVRCLLAQHC
jgi:putative phosphoribosyl transferase